MLEQIFEYLKAWINGEEAELHVYKTWSFGWWELGAMLIIIGLMVNWMI